ALTASVLSLATPHVANACTLLPGNNWAAARWWNIANVQDGGTFDTTVSPIGISGAPNGNHINQSLWVGTDGSHTIYPDDYWVEMGYIKGFACDTNLDFYWADERPTYGFAKHQITAFTPVVGDGYSFQIVYVGNTNWNVNLDLSNAGVSTDNGPNS